MNVNNMTNNGPVSIKEIYQGISKEELAVLCQALESKAEKVEEDQELKDALQDFRRILETEKPSVAKTAASRLLKDFSVSMLVNALGDSVRTIIQNLARM